MGDRYLIYIKCAKCKKLNQAYYAESCGSTDFECEKCKTINKIVMTFKAKLKKSLIKQI